MVRLHVQDPPGSGKTTLILHLIAQQVVQRALNLIENGKDINKLKVKELMKKSWSVILNLLLQEVGIGFLILIETSVVNL